MGIERGWSRWLAVPVAVKKEKKVCLERICEERRKREHLGVAQNMNPDVPSKSPGLGAEQADYNSGGGHAKGVICRYLGCTAEQNMESMFKMQYQDQIGDVNLKLEESKRRQTANMEMRKEKMGSLIEKQKLEKKMLIMKSDQEIMKLENKKSRLLQQLAILQQNLDYENQIKKTKEEEIEKKHQEEKTILENKFESEVKEDEENVDNLEEIINQLSKNLRELEIKPKYNADINLEAARDTLECPVCFDIMRPPTRIWMCSASHLVCQNCKERQEGRICSTCMTEEVTLRAFFTEKLARTIFTYSRDYLSDETGEIITISDDL